MRVGFVMALVCLVACGLGEDKFQEQYAAKSCELLASCDDAQVSFGDQGDCETFYGILVEASVAGCDYSGTEARACLKALDEASCDAAVAGVAVCTQVYSGDECAWSMSESTGTTTATE